MPDVRSLLKLLFFFSASGATVATVVAVSLWYIVWPTLPDVESLREVRLHTPLRIYSGDGKLMREFGEKRRVPLGVDDVPESLKNAIIATEDRNFRRHFGVDPIGIARAVLFIVREGRKGPGGSTITMQVARNFFLDRGKTYTRKLTEIMLALKIERELSKDEILKLYVNKIFLGHRAYGVGAAAQVYYGKRVDELSIAQIAMIAGLPQRPSDFNPITNPDKALKRRNHVLWRLTEEGYLLQEKYLVARAEPLSAVLHAAPIELSAAYVAEMARQQIKQRYGDRVFATGLRVYTTLREPLQQAADAALRRALVNYDQRHGWRGPELKLTLNEAQLRDSGAGAIDRMLLDVPTLGGMSPAVILEVRKKSVRAYVKRHGEVEVGWKNLDWARPYINNYRRGKTPKSINKVLVVGDVVRVQREKIEDGESERWRLMQLPEVEGAFVALDPKTGAILALSGGFDFNHSKFNRVTQALRQPGSSFKPFIYSAALANGFTAASTINDAPVVFDDAGLESAWRPENYSGKSYGPTRLRLALTKSRNLVSIRLLRAVGIDKALEHVQRFGIDASKLPRDLSLSLGSGGVKPLDIATGYAVLANGGYQVHPYLIDRIEDAQGKLIYRASPRRVCDACDPSEQAERTLTAENAWLMYSMMRDVVQAGTAVKAKKLKRSELAGKTGTTNEQRDAWFSGFNSSIVGTAWVGFDRVQPMGRAETGGRAALPMWIDFMGQALKLEPYASAKMPKPPKDLITVRIDAETGLLAGAKTSNTLYEFFRPDNAPDRNDKLRKAAAAASAQKEATAINKAIW